MSRADKIRQVKNVFVATKELQKIIDSIENIRDLSIIDRYQNLPNCMFVTGETGVGKSTLIEKYMEENMPYEIEYGESESEGESEGEKTIVPVLYCELPKAKHPKPVVTALLEELGFPEKAIKGDVPKLTKTLVKALIDAKVELIIIDEFQHAIETTNKNVIQDIGEWFKILLNKAKRPIVFVGVPWSYPVLEINAQLRRRVRKRKFKIPNYTLETFEEFQDFIRAVVEQLPLKVYESLDSGINAFRLFAASKGNLSELIEGIIEPAAILAIDESRAVIELDDLIEAIEENTDFIRENNPFVLELEEIEAEVQCKESTWNPLAKKQEQRVLPPEYAIVKFADLKFNEAIKKR